MKKIITIISIILITLLLATSIFACTGSGRTEQTQADRTGNYDLLKNTIDFIKNNYYRDMDEDEADRYAALGVMSSLGEFNYIYSESSLDDSSSSSDGGGFGLIVKFNRYNEIYIDLILDGSPFLAPSNGFQPRRGDEIYSIAGNRVNGAGSYYFSSIVSATKLDEYTDFVLRRDGEFYNVTYKKVVYNFPQCIYIDNLEGIDPDLGYIYLRSFSSYKNSIPSEFRNCVEQFKADGNKGLILDLRGNGGGNADVLRAVASYLIGSPSKGTVDLLEVDNVKEDYSTVYSVKPNNNYIDTPIYVLCDGGTASASEALIGAMRANKTLTALIGKETVGKGVAQNGFIYYDGKEKGNIIDYVTDENGNVVEGELFYLQTVIGQYYIFDDSVEGGKYCMNGIPFVPEYYIEEEYSPITFSYADDLYVSKANELFLSK